MSFLSFMRCYLWDITYYVTSFVRPRWCKPISATSLVGRCLFDVIFTMLLEQLPLLNFIYATAFVWLDLCNLIFVTSLVLRHFYDVFMWRQLCDIIYVKPFMRFHCDAIDSTSFLRRCFMYPQLCDVIFLSLFFSDVSMVVIGFVVVFFYVICLLGKFDKIENRVNSKFQLKL